MDGAQVEFGRRGRDLHPTQTPARATHGPYGSEGGGKAIAPNAEVSRSLNKALMYIGICWLVIMLAAGHTKNHTDLPYWMRPDADFRISDYLFPAAICVLATIAVLGPMLRRLTALKLYDDHVEFVPLFGATRSVAWAQVGDITKSSWYWSEHRYVYVEVIGGRRLSISTEHLAMSRDELVDLLNYSRSNSARRHLHLSGEPISGQYLFPGH